MDLPQAVIPVPIHPVKLAYRGFNQTALLSKVLSERLAIVNGAGWIMKIRADGAQAGKSAVARRRMSQRNFAVQDVQTIQQMRHIAIFDDVITTGSTLHSMITCIKKVNPDIRIDLWALSISLQR